MEIGKLRSILEALIFVSEEPLGVGAMTFIMEPDGVTKADIEIAITEIGERYNNDESCGVYLNEVAGGYQFRTKPGMADYIQKLNLPKSSKLSQPALETLAIIAYRQPIVRSEIEDIRGVDTGGVLRTLLERNLIRIIGKRDEPGNPLIYCTSEKFLELFNLNSLKELPTLREYEDLEKEHYTAALKEKEDEQPMLVGVNASPFVEKWESEDGHLLTDLTSSIKNLRRIEKDIFPKPVETIIAVPNPEGANNAVAPSEEGESAVTPAEDTGTGE